jgi:hypothetical protein
VEDEDNMSEIEDNANCVGSEEALDMAFDAVSVDPLGPVYTTGKGDKDAVRNERYCPTLGT